jgi:hypothetical protein
MFKSKTRKHVLVYLFVKDNISKVVMGKGFASYGS